MPIIYNVDQGSPEWFLIRQGIPTASEFSRLMTGANRQFSVAAHKYAAEKVAEIITGQQQGSDYVSDDMLMGNIIEQEAAESYEFTNEVRTEKVGFVTDDEGRYGCSPDRFVGRWGIVEIKRKNPTDMVKFLIERRIDPAHIPQIQGNLLVTGRLWCDWHLYNENMPRLTIRTWRNERYISDLRQDLDMFSKLIRAKLRALAEADYIDLPEIAERAAAARVGIKGERIKEPRLDPEAIKIMEAAHAA